MYSHQKKLVESLPDALWYLDGHSDALAKCLNNLRGITSLKTHKKKKNLANLKREETSTHQNYLH